MSRITIGLVAAHALVQTVWMLWAQAVVGQAPGAVFGSTGYRLATSLNLLVSMGMIAAFIGWVRRIVLNSRALSTTTITRSIWSGAWMLVPLANMVMPYLVTRDLWHATHDGRARRMPANVQTPPIVGAWWLLGLGATTWACLAPMGLQQFVPASSISPHVVALPISVAHLAVMARIVHAITAKQSDQRSAEGVAPEELPPKRALN